MKVQTSSLRRAVSPRHRVELRGPRRARTPRRLGIRTRCGYLLFTRFV